MAGEDKFFDNNEKKIPEPETSRLMDDVMTAILMNATKPSSLELSDHGQVRKIDIPPGWEEGPNYDGREHSASYKEFHPAGDKDCQLGFYYRGRRTSEAAGKNFHDQLAKPPHALSADELKSVAEIIRDKSNPADFNTKSARTEDVNGKRVLILEGQYTANKQYAKHLFVDSDNTGTAVQEIFFQAPEHKFQNFSKPADEALKSIKWK